MTTNIFYNNRCKLQAIGQNAGQTQQGTNAIDFQMMYFIKFIINIIKYNNLKIYKNNHLYIL